MYVLVFTIFFILIQIINNLKILRVIEFVLKNIQHKYFPWLSIFEYITRERITQIHNKVFQELNIQKIFESTQNIAEEPSSEESDDTFV